MEIPRSYSLIIHSLLKKSVRGQRFLGFIILAGLLAPSPANASTIIYTGTTAGGPTWNRPVANDLDPPIELSSDGDAVPYDAHGFTVDTAGLYSLFSAATDPFGWDNYTFLYVTSFDPTNPLQNVVIGNDDDPVTGSSGFDATLITNTNYFLVTTGFADFDAGAFQNTIDLLQAETIPPDPGASAPEPNTLFLFGAGIVLAGVGRKHFA
jgi:hypothetical protein